MTSVDVPKPDSEKRTLSQMLGLERDEQEECHFTSARIAPWMCRESTMVWRHSALLAYDRLGWAVRRAIYAQGSSMMALGAVWQDEVRGAAEEFLKQPIGLDYEEVKWDPMKLAKDLEKLERLWEMDLWWTLFGLPQRSI